MKKLLTIAALLLAVILLAPHAIALVVVGILAPAAVSVIDCGVDRPGAATGDWRPPFQQRYVLTYPFGRRFHPIYGRGPICRRPRRGATSRDCG